MGKSIAFYAPLKSPHHGTPSGDRTIARGLIAALEDIKWVDHVDLASELRSRDGSGDLTVQQDLLDQAEKEIARILNQDSQLDSWLTYHNYYKAPDLIGPAICTALNIPYFLVEASKSPKRANGPWAQFSAISDTSCDQAQSIFYFTQRDLPELQGSKPESQTLIHLPPFLNRTDLPKPTKAIGKNKFLAVGMFRAGDKLASYTALAAALQQVSIPDWTLDIIGSGPAEPQVRSLFQDFGSKVTFHGQLPTEDVEKQMQQSSALLWPGVNEAFGMVYLEAQSIGLPIIAENRPGVRDVIGPHSLMTPPNDPVSYAVAIEKTMISQWDTEHSQNYIRKHHLRPSATETLARGIGTRHGVTS